MLTGILASDCEVNALDAFLGFFPKIISET